MLLMGTRRTHGHPPASLGHARHETEGGNPINSILQSFLIIYVSKTRRLEGARQGTTGLIWAGRKKGKMANIVARP